MPSLPLVVIPHPLAGLKPDEVRARAEAALGDVIHVLTRPRVALSQEYKGKVYPQPKKIFRAKHIFE